MPVKKKYRKLTNKEKEFNKRIREELRADGIIPPIKPRLNRKKFLEESKKEFDENILTIADTYYVLEAIAYMTPIKEKITPEGVGVLKVMKAAVEIKKFREEKEAQGEKTYKVSELYERIKVIREL